MLWVGKCTECDEVSETRRGYCPSGCGETMKEVECQCQKCGDDLTGNEAVDVQIGLEKEVWCKQCELAQAEAEIEKSLGVHE